MWSSLGEFFQCLIAGPFPHSSLVAISCNGSLWGGFRGQVVVACCIILVVQRLLFLGLMSSLKTSSQPLHRPTPTLKNKILLIVCIYAFVLWKKLYPRPTVPLVHKKSWQPQLRAGSFSLAEIFYSKFVNLEVFHSLTWPTPGIGGGYMIIFLRRT